MSAEDAIVTAGSAIVVAFLLLMVFLAGFRGGQRLDERSLAEALRVAEPDAQVAEALVGADGRGALARLADGRLATVRVMGDGTSVRVFRLENAFLRLRASGLSVGYGDPGYPDLHLRLNAEPPAWLKDLAA